MGEKKKDLRIKISALLDAGIAVAAIAQQLSISRQRVYAIARDNVEKAILLTTQVMGV